MAVRRVGDIVGAEWHENSVLRLRWVDCVAVAGVLAESASAQK